MTTTEQLEERIKIKDFNTPEERTFKGYRSLVGLYEIIRDLKTIKENGKISNNESYEFDRRVKEGNDPEYCNETQRALLESISITIGENSYSLRAESKARHEQREGGENIVYSFLERDQVPVLVCLQYLSYSTSSDDSTDELNRAIKRIELIDKNDELAKEIFEAIKTRIK